YKHALGIEYAEHLLLIRQRCFTQTLRQFDTRLSCRITKLVYPIKCGVWLARYEVGSHTEHVNRCTLFQQALDHILVELIGCRNLDIMQTCRIQHLSSVSRQVSEVAAIETYAFESFATCLHLMGNDDC